MLVLSRKVSERIHIGNDIFVEVRRVAGNRVTLAISAPKNVRILRGELMEAAHAFDVLEETSHETPSAEHASTSQATTETVIIPRDVPLPVDLAAASVQMADGI